MVWGGGNNNFKINYNLKLPGKIYTRTPPVLNIRVKIKIRFKIGLGSRLELMIGLEWHILI